MTALTREIARVGVRVVVNDAMPAYRGWAGTVIRATPSPGEPGRPFNWVKVKLDDHPHPAQWHVSYFDLLPEQELKMEGDPQFTLYWRDGKRETVRGRTIAEAMTLAGYSQGAVRALDFYADGADQQYEWSQSDKMWKRTVEQTVLTSRS